MHRLRAYVGLGSPRSRLKGGRAAAILAVGLSAGLVLTTTPAPGSVEQPAIVLKNPVDYTPQLVPTTAEPTPHVDALTQSGQTVYAGGLFTQVVDEVAQDHARTHLFSFDAGTGAVSSFAPVLDGQVWALEAVGDSIYVGGDFNTVNGVTRRKLVKFDATTGEVDTTFNAKFNGGRVTEVRLVSGRLIVGGSMGKKLVALDPATGADTGYINLAITDQIPASSGTVAVFKFAVNPAADKLVAVGNFMTVAGESRTRLFMLDLGPTSATLAPWYYDGFAKACSSVQPRRIAYLQDVDFSPAGDYFVVVGTGQISKPADLGVTVCDASGKFDASDDTAPLWINSTGGDSVWSVAVTGPAVYVQGHFTWLDNAGGWQNHPVATAASRRGIGAIDPVTGKALAWNPPKPAAIGGKDLLATTDGLWVGSDSANFKGEAHHGLAFVPLP